MPFLKRLENTWYAEGTPTQLLTDVLQPLVERRKQADRIAL